MELVPDLAAAEVVVPVPGSAEEAAVVPAHGWGVQFHVFLAKMFDVPLVVVAFPVQRKRSVQN